MGFFPQLNDPLLCVTPRDNWNWFCAHGTSLYAPPLIDFGRHACPLSPLTYSGFTASFASRRAPLRNPRETSRPYLRAGTFASRLFCTLLKCCWDLRAGGSSISKTRRSRRPARGKRGYPCHDAAIQRNAIKSVGNVETLKTRRGRHGRYAVRDQFVRSLSLYTRAPLLCANKCRDSCPTCTVCYLEQETRISRPRISHGDCGRSAQGHEREGDQERALR